MKHLLLFFLLPCLLQAQSPHPNILITNNYNPNEPTLALDPNNPNIMLGGSNIDNLYISKDAGKTWREKKLESSYGVWGDPVIICDTTGSFYFFHLSNPPNGSWIDRIICQRSDNQGRSWTNGSYMGLNGRKAQDKHWAVVDRKKNYIYVTWTQFDKYKSADPKDKSSIRFSMSKDKGETWTTAKKINEVEGDCLDNDDTTEGAVPTIGPDGEVYVAWAGPAGLVFDRSLDEGNTWLDNDIKIDPMPGGWDLHIPGISRCNGMPITSCDLSGNEHHGTIYVNWADQRNGTKNTDIWLSKSTDKGDTWSTPVRVNNDDSERHQFLTWMTIDDKTGYLYFVFYDRRDTKGNATEVYMARSTDGGATFTNFRVSQSPFIPNPNIFFGDYNNIVAQGDIIRPIWTRLDGEKLGMYTALIDVTKIDDAQSLPDTSRLHENTDLAHKYLHVSFKTHDRQKLTLLLRNANNKKVKILFRKKAFDMGKHIEKFEKTTLDLPKGNYTYQLKQGCKTIKSKPFVIE